MFSVSLFLEISLCGIEFPAKFPFPSRRGSYRFFFGKFSIYYLFLFLSKFLFNSFFPDSSHMFLAIVHHYSTRENFQVFKSVGPAYIRGIRTMVKNVYFKVHHISNKVNSQSCFFLEGIYTGTFTQFLTFFSLFSYRQS